MPARVCVFCRREPAQAPWIPFCSERCKLQDLARWVDGSYHVPAEPVQQDAETDTLEHDGGVVSERRESGDDETDQ
ncbi:MAG TPA: DNA gyrase inhibitor YacG [Vicinamibacterales bacterium]|nr:DNA gyrase inhibitor YacG [Vicinamibacterales bacterium]